MALGGIYGNGKIRNRRVQPLGTCDNERPLQTEEDINFSWSVQSEFLLGALQVRDDHIERLEGELAKAQEELRELREAQGSVVSE